MRLWDRKGKGFAKICTWREPSAMTHVCSVYFVLEVSQKKKNVLPLEAEMFLLLHFCALHRSVAGLWSLLQCYCWLCYYPGTPEIFWSRVYLCSLVFSLLLLNVRNIRKLSLRLCLRAFGKLYHEVSPSFSENCISFLKKPNICQGNGLSNCLYKPESWIFSGSYNVLA